MEKSGKLSRVSVKIVEESALPSLNIDSDAIIPSSKNVNDDSDYANFTIE